MNCELTAVCLFLVALSCTALKCHEDATNPDDSNYYLNDCSPDTAFCAVLRNSKTSETFHACATDRMCSRVGNFDYHQHPELHIRCCNADGCNGSSALTISVVTFAFATFIAIIRHL